MKKLYAFIIATIIFHTMIFGNNIQVDSISLEGQVVAGQYVFVEFDVSWENSWRTSGVPENWDAAWVFAKYSIAGGEWQHMKISTNGFTAPSGCTVDVVSDSVGAFLHRSADGTGNINWDNIQLRWDYGLLGISNDAFIEVRVFAIEMVYVPAGAFYLGDGAALYRWHEGNNNALPFHITSAGPITMGQGAGQIWNMEWAGPSGDISADYPEGYSAFYCMKYEISQEQYAEFLNTLTRAQQNARTQSDLTNVVFGNHFVMSAGSNPSGRNGIRTDYPAPPSGPLVFYCHLSELTGETGEGENIPCNYMLWQDFAAYVDWSGLRPISEMEYEKACRGPNMSVNNEYAWGNTLLRSAPGVMPFQNRGAYNETVTIALDSGNAACNGQTALLLRCGIFAASSPNHTRTETGATYYGIMEMSGNICEYTANAHAVAGWSYTGMNGDGTLTAAGDANEDHWPGINGNSNPNVGNGVFGGTTGVTGVAGSGIRGGCWDFDSVDMMVSDRRVVDYHPSIRVAYYGGRGVRTAD